MLFIDKFILKFSAHLLSILQSVEGCFAAFGIFVLNYIAGHETSIGLLLLSVILDLGWGIAAAIKQRKFALSELARESISKLSVYGTAVCFFMAIDKLTTFDIGITVPIICGIIILVECWSFLANAIIVCPNVQLLHILAKVLAGEIASKLNIDPSEVENYLKQLQKKGK